MEESETKEEEIQTSPAPTLREAPVADLSPQSERKEEFIIPIPPSACRQDLVELKEFLSGQTPGNISLKIEVKGQVIDTKVSVADTSGVREWTSKRWR